MDLKTAGKQKFFKIEIQDKGGYAIGFFPCAGKVTKALIVHGQAEDEYFSKFEMAIGKNTFPDRSSFYECGLSGNANNKPKIKNTEYTFKKGDKFEFNEHGHSIKEVILYIE
ncbi:MAG: hypothetical protein V4547_17945 [Bacteroidota bacterium]